MASGLTNIIDLASGGPTPTRHRLRHRHDTVTTPSPTPSPTHVTDTVTDHLTTVTTPSPYRHRHSTDARRRTFCANENQFCSFTGRGRSATARTASTPPARSPAASVARTRCSATRLRHRQDVRLFNQIQPPPNTQSPYLGSPFAIPTIIQAELRQRGEGVAYHFWRPPT